MAWDSNIYIIDINDKEVHFKNKPLNTTAIRQNFIDFAKETFFAYEAENHPKSVSEKQAAVITDDYEGNAEPWTGIWEVVGHRNIIGQWAMKQTNKAVISTSDSSYKLSGDTQGSQLKGSIYGDLNIRARFIIFISPDGRSFEGKISYDYATHPIKGKKIE